MLVDCYIVFPDNRVVMLSVPSTLNVGETFIADMVIYKITEKGVISLRKTVHFLVLEEVEGFNNPPSGKYNWIENARQI